MPGALKVAKIGGIEISVHWTWIVIFFLIAWASATRILDDWFPEWSDGQRWLGGVAISALFFASLLLHELAHSFVAIRKGIDVRGIMLFALGGVSNLKGEPKTASDEFQIAVVGPATSFLLGVLFIAGWAVLRPFSEGPALISAQLGVMNGIIAVFNMLPGFPLDGGRVFRSAIWARNKNLLAATRSASRLGEVFGYVLMGLGVVFFLFGDLFNGIWFFVLGMFLRGMASASYQQLLTQVTLKGVTAFEAANKDCQPVPPDLSVEDLVDDYVLPRGTRCFPVQAAGKLLGLVTLDDIRQVPRDRWSGTSVFKTMTSFERLHAVAPEEDLRRVMQIMSEEDVNQVPVLRDHELVGMISRSDILRLMQVRREIAEEV